MAEKPLVVGVLKEVKEGESRVAATPSTVEIFAKKGLAVMVEKGAGEGSIISDGEYKKAGAVLADAEKIFREADIILRVNPPQEHPKTGKSEAGMIKKGAVWVSMLHPAEEAESLRIMAKKGVTCFSMTLIPRVSRAQKMDALTSQATVAGYKAVLLGANHLKKMMPLTMTAAGTLRAAKVVVLGAGVAGLQAIATARRLGAQVEASDVRPAAKEQVESLGASFIDVPFDKDAEDKSGYAKKVSKEFLERQEREVAKRLKTADLVITTALIQGRKAPLLIKEEMVRGMPSGSVIVDLAASNGGNCELTEAGKVVVRHGVTIVGHTSLPSLVPVHASRMYANNICSFTELLLKEGRLSIDTKDEIVAECLVLDRGRPAEKWKGVIEGGN